MSRPVQHHAYVRRAFDSICEDLAADGPAIIDAATEAASGFAADLAGYLENRLGFFDQDERVRAVVGSLDQTDGGATLGLEWSAEPGTRLLPNVEATIHVAPIISGGPGATSELTLQGEYRPIRTRHRGIVEHALARRVVDATLHTFLRHLVDELEHDRPRL